MWFRNLSLSTNIFVVRIFAACTKPKKVRKEMTSYIFVFTELNCLIHRLKR